MPLKDFLFTSESVSEGHPDKMCDQISDAVLDALIAEDPDSRVALESLVKTGLIVMAGEITSRSSPDFVKIARKTALEIGYDNDEIGFNGNSPELMPLPIELAHRLMENLSKLRKEKKLDFLRPDGKSQVTVRYVNGQPVAVTAVVVSTQHSAAVGYTTIREAIIEELIKRTIPEQYLDKSTVYHVNPTGSFVIGGPHGDCGVTGRKIIVDSYGGYGRHGGGAFSGKDPSKVDRSACYMARHVAKNIVAAGLAAKCEIQVAYAIGVAEPLSILVDTFDTGIVPEHRLSTALRELFDFRPAAIIKTLNLKRPIYKATAAYGHFGRTPHDGYFPWEQVDMIDALRSAFGVNGEG